MKPGMFVEWPGGVGQIDSPKAAVGTTESTVVLYRELDGFFEPTDQRINVRNSAMTEIKPLPVATGFQKFWNGVKRAFLVERDVALYAMMYAASEIIYQRGYFVMDYYTDGAQVYAIAIRDYEEVTLWQFPVQMNGADVQVGEPQEVIQSFAPVTRIKTVVFRNAKGQRCWHSVASIPTINRSGQLDSMALYDSMEEYADRTKDLPYLTVWHAEEALRCGQVTLVHRDEMAYVNAGVFDDTDWGNSVADALERHPEKYGVSIGFLVTEDPIIEIIEGRAVPIFRKGRQVELSILPEDSAASLMTSMNVIRGINEMNDAKYRESMIDLAGGNAELAERMMEAAKSVTREVKEKGLVTREAETEVATPAVTEIVIDEAAFAAALVTNLENSEAFKSLRADIAAIKTKQDEIERSLKLPAPVTPVPAAPPAKTENPDLPRATVRAVLRPSVQNAKPAGTTPLNLAERAKAAREAKGVNY